MCPAVSVSRVGRVMDSRREPTIVNAGMSPDETDSGAQTVQAPQEFVRAMETIGAALAFI